MISEIINNENIYLENVLHFRGNVTSELSAEISVQIEDMLKKNAASKIWNTITVTHDIQIKDGKQVLDLEIFIPLDKRIPTYGDFDLIPVFSIKSALKVRVFGDTLQIEQAIKNIYNYVNSNKLIVTTPICIVTIKEALSNDDLITDVYIGVNN